jgi:hypothetical protein
MERRYPWKKLAYITAALLLFTIASCKKNDTSKTQSVVPAATPARVGLYEGDSSIYKELDIAISGIGNKTVDYGLVFDTGSGGMVLDGNGILSSSMIANSGFNITGDSLVVNGITIMAQTAVIEYGDDAANTDKVYGNLAYANVTVGDQTGDTFVIKRLPFFLYYKAVDAKGKVYPAHEFDVFGVNSEYDITFANNAYITSPFSYFSPGNGLTKGFKMPALGTSDFSQNFNYVPGAVTLGLTADDLSSSSGFVFSTLSYYSGDGYPPVFRAAVTYGSTTASTNVIFDTGTDPYSYIEDTKGPTPAALLPQNTSVNITTTSGFNYAFTTSSTDNLTYAENSTTSGTDVSVISLEFFLNNSYLLDYTDHKLGLKNN